MSNSDAGASAIQSQDDRLVFTEDATNPGVANSTTSLGAVETDAGFISMESIRNAIEGNGSRKLEQVAKEAGLGLKTVYNFMHSINDDKPQDRTIGTGAKLALFIMKRDGDMAALSFLKSLEMPTRPETFSA